MKTKWQHTARRLRDIRGAFLLTQSDAAEIAGVTLRTWRNWETGGKGPHSSLPLIRFVGALGISGDWFLCGDTIEDTRRRFGPLGMDKIPDVKAKHRARIAALAAEGRRAIAAAS